MIQKKKKWKNRMKPISVSMKNLNAREVSWIKLTYFR